MWDLNRIDFSKIDWDNIEIKPKNSKKFLDNLKINLDTRWEHSELAKNSFWINLEKISYLARIDYVAEKVNTNSSNFKNIYQDFLNKTKQESKIA